MNNSGEIIVLYLNRQETAIQETAGKFGHRLRSLAYGILQSRESAEECENDTYLRAWNTIPPNEPYTYLYPYLARITRHIAIDLCRSRKRLKRDAYLCELSEEMEQCIPAPDNCEQRIDDMLLREALNGFLRTLGREKRNVFLRRYWYLDSIADISQRYSLSESKIKSMLFRCRKELRNYLEKEGYQL